MASYQLCHTPDSTLTTYTLWQDAGPIGEIRWHDLHASAMYLGERGLWLRHDEGAAVAAQGGSWLSRFYAEMKFTRSWSLHGEGRVLARAQRRWHWRPSRDVLLLSPEPDAAPLTAASPGILAREMAISNGQKKIGSLRLCGLLQNRIELDWPGLDPARAALFMYAMHRAYGPTGAGASGGVVD